MIVRDGRGLTTDHGPSRARLQGYAGSLVVYHRPPEKPQVHYGDPNAARKRLRGEAMLDRKRPKCGILLGTIREPCARLSGHADGKGGGHRSAEALASDAEKRRYNRPSRAVEWGR